MKYSLVTFLLTSSTLLLANPTTAADSTTSISNHLQDAVTRVETARDNTLSALKAMVTSVDEARKEGVENNHSISTKIIETHAISQIAKGTASVEIAKAKAKALITQAIDKLDPTSLQIVANAVADVEVAKAKAKELIVNVTERVELSKTKMHKHIEHPEETLTIAKNVSAISIAKSVAQTEVARAVSLIEIARSSVESAIPESMKTLSKESAKKLAQIKAEATANISSYLAQIEIMKANMLAKIAEEVARVEIAKLHIQHNENNVTETKSSKN